MKLFTKILASAGLALGAMTAVTAPATAQVQGNVATADVSRAIIGSNAFQTAYNQIQTTYAGQIQQGQTKQQELAALLAPFDANGDGGFDETELAAIQAAPQFTQIQTLEQEIGALQQQVNFARIFAIEQILVQYPAALGQVVSSQQIVIVMQPETLQYFADSANITPQISASLNTLVPSVQIVPPADYRPSREGAQIFQEIQAILVDAQRRQAAQQAAQPQPAAQAPAGR